MTAQTHEPYMAHRGPTTRSPQRIWRGQTVCGKESAHDERGGGEEETYDESMGKK